MNLLEIDNIEVYAVFIRVVDGIQGPSLGPERRSGIAAEDQCNRTLAKMIRQRHALTLTLIVL